MCVVVDEYSPARTDAELIGVLVHAGPPMRIEYRNLMLKVLPLAAGSP